MPIEMPKGIPFSVDTWKTQKRHRFLSHAHKDHTFSLSSHIPSTIFCSSLTKSLLLLQFPQLGRGGDGPEFVGIEAGKSILVDDPDGSFTVSAFDANHCPGALMFLFEGKFGNILHTGDCRLTPECLRSLPEKYVDAKGKKPRCSLDYVFLDCTFGKFYRAMPSKHVATRQVIDCIWRHSNAEVVYLTCDLLGQEEILAAVSKTFGSKIYVDEAANPERYQALTLVASQILSQDSSSRFHLLDGFPKLNERAKAMLMEAKANSKPEPLIIRPSAMWYACETEVLQDGRRRKLRMDMATMDQFGVWHVCYSMHSSREELEWALQILAPKWVISTTPSCMSTELDYVKKHCVTSQLSPNDPLWKLLDISVEAEDTSTKSAVRSPVLEEIAQSSCGSQLQPEKIVAPQKKLFNLSPPSKRPPVTLFGRARIGLQESPWREQKNTANKDDKETSLAAEKLEKEFLVKRKKVKA